MLAPSEMLVFLWKLNGVNLALSIEEMDAGLTNDVVHCSMLAEDAIKSAISNYYTKNPKAKTTNLAGTGSSMPKVEVETVMDPSAPMDAPAQQTMSAH